MKFPYPDWDLAPTQGQHPFALWCVTRTFSQNLSNASLALYDISNRTMPSLLRESPLPIRRDRNTNQWPWASKQSPLALGLNDSINPSLFQHKPVRPAHPPLVANFVAPLEADDVFPVFCHFGNSRTLRSAGHSDQSPPLRSLS